MALQIRRGTSTEVISNQFVPAEGELIYTTDTKRVFVGDGFTIGGVDITSSGGTGGALTTNLDLNNQDITGIGDISISGLIVTDSEFRGNLRGDVIGDLAGNVIGTVVGELEGSVFGAGSTLLIDGDNNLIVGDTSGSIINADGEYVLDNRPTTVSPVFHGTVSGNVIGDLYGDIYGNVVGIDSLLMVDATNTVLRVRDIEISENNINAGAQSLNIKSNNIRALEVFGSTTGAPGNIPYIHLNTSRGTIESPLNMQPGDIIGGFGFRAYNGNDYKLTAANLFAVIDPTANMADLAPKTAFIIQTGRGNTDVNYFTYSSQFTASGYGFHFASFNTSTGNFDNFADATARDSMITNPSPGMITYVENNGSGSPKFQGYVSDTGGGSPGWVDLH